MYRRLKDRANPHRLNPYRRRRLVQISDPSNLHWPFRFRRVLAVAWALRKKLKDLKDRRSRGTKQIVVEGPRRTRKQTGFTALPKSSQSAGGKPTCGRWPLRWIRDHKSSPTAPGRERGRLGRWGSTRLIPKIKHNSLRKIIS